MVDEVGQVNHIGESKVFDIGRGFRLFIGSLNAAAERRRKGDMALCRLGGGLGVKCIGRWNGIFEVEGADFAAGIALVVEPVEHHLLLVRRERTDSGEAAGLGRSFRV